MFDMWSGIHIPSSLPTFSIVRSDRLGLIFFLNYPCPFFFFLLAWVQVFCERDHAFGLQMSAPFIKLVSMLSKNTFFPYSLSRTNSDSKKGVERNLKTSILPTAFES